MNKTQEQTPPPLTSGAAAMAMRETVALGRRSPEAAASSDGRLRAGEISPDAIDQVARDLEGTAMLCLALYLLGEHSVIEGEAVDALGQLVRQAAKNLRAELAEAGART